MTLVVAASNEDYVVLCADDRTTIKSVQEDIEVQRENAKKLFKVNENVGMLLYGGCPEIANYVIKNYIKQEKIKEMGVTDIAKSFSKFCKKWVDDEFCYPEVLRATRIEIPDFGVIITGLDKNKVNRRWVYEPRIYVSEGHNCYFSIQEPIEKFVFRGVWLWAEYISREFKEGMSLEDLTRLVVKTIYDTHLMNGSVGKPTELVIIDADGFQYKNEDLERIIRILEEH